MSWFRKFATRQLAPLLVALSCLMPALAAPPVRLVYPVYSSGQEGQAGFDWIVLRAALERTVPHYGPYSLEQWKDAMSAQRMVQELALPAGKINVIARATDLELERKLLPIRIPIDRGLMGMRLLLVRKADLRRFAAVRTLADLKGFSAGQGKDWIDSQILLHSGFNVVESPRFGSLYGMLEGRRFDFFPRAVDEAHAEADAHQNEAPGMVVEPTLMLHYVLPRYFFVRRDADGERLGQRIKAGMEMMVADGSLGALFRQHKGPLVERAALSKRRVIELPNPSLSPETPLQRSELWFRP